MEFQIVQISHHMTDKEEEVIFQLLEDAELPIEDIQHALMNNKVGLDDWIIKEFVKVLASNHAQEIAWIDGVADHDIRRLMIEHCRDLIADRQLFKMIKDKQ